MRLLYEELLKRSLIVPVLTILLFSLSPAFSQTNRIFSGTVSDEKGTPLHRASVILKGKSQGVSTNANGTFSILISAKCQLPK